MPTSKEITSKIPEQRPNERPVALITGITGQDGSYLVDLQYLEDRQPPSAKRTLAFSSADL